MIAFPSFVVLVVIQVFGASEVYAFLKRTGRIKSLEGTKTGLPLVSIGDDNSIRLQVYESQTEKFFWCKQPVSIEHRRGEFYEELDIVTVSCENLHKLHKVVKKNFINFGDAIFLNVEEENVIALFVWPSGLCTRRTYTNRNDDIEKTTETINSIECKKILNEISSNYRHQSSPNTLIVITPETPEGSETVGPTYLPTKVVSTPIAERKTIKSTKPQNTFKPGSRDWPQVEDNLMELLSADGVVEVGYKPLDKDVDEVRRYSKGSVSITMQNLYKSFNRNEDEKCVRLLIISYGAIEIQRVTVTCGPVTGLTMTDRFIKYRRAFALHFSTPPNGYSMFNVKGKEDCISRTYFVQLIDKKPWHLVERMDKETQEEPCLVLKKGSVSGLMFDTIYDDKNTGLQDGIMLEINPPEGPAFNPEDAFDLSLVGGPGPIFSADSNEDVTAYEETDSDIYSEKSEISKSQGVKPWGSSLWGKLIENENRLLSSKSQ